jgi:hypothetical protein
VSTTHAVVVRGRDGKTYPRHRRSERDLDRVVHLTHQLRCEGRLPMREVARHLADEYGIRRPVGAVAPNLELYRCDRCDGRPA